MKNVKPWIVLFSVLVSIVLASPCARSSENNTLPTYQVHTVKAGETLSKIAKAYYDDYGKAALIARFNNIEDINRLRIGQKIKIPAPPPDPSKKVSTVSEVDLGGADKGGGGALGEENLKKGPAGLRLDGGSLVFILVYLVLMLSLLLIRWIGLQDNGRAEKPDEPVRFFRLGNHRGKGGPRSIR